MTDSEFIEKLSSCIDKVNNLASDLYALEKSQLNKEDMKVLHESSDQITELFYNLQKLRRNIALHI